MSHSAFIIFNIISSRRFSPFDIMSHSAFTTFDIISGRCFLPFNIMSRLAFFTFVLMSFHHFIPFNVLSFRRFLPFNIFSVDVLSHSTFFYHRHSLLWHFVGELFRALYSGKSLIWVPESWDPQEARTFSDSQYSYPMYVGLQNGMRSASTSFSQAQWRSVRVSKEQGLKRSIPL